MHPCNMKFISFLTENTIRLHLSDGTVDISGWSEKFSASTINGNAVGKIFL
jgi:hypothetical protein